ncbi:MAG: PIN domain-containing protein, partial [Gemmataceae bacterium]
GAALDDVAFRVSQLRLRVIPFDEALSPLAASIHAGSRKLGYSLGDCCCLACGLLLDLPVLTADSRWSLLDSSVRVELIR